MAHRILSVCYNECLPPSTLEFLEANGCELKCAREIGAAIQLFESLPFELILINHTVSASQEHLLAQLVREQSNIPIIFMSNIRVPSSDADATLPTPVTPEELLKTIFALTAEHESLRP